MDKPIYLYALLDPSSGEARYIGQTIRPTRRLRDHLAKARKGTRWYVCRWIRTLLAEGREPVMQVVGVVPTREMADVFEKSLIANSKAQGVRLTNTEEGGWTNTMSEETRAKIRAAAIKRCADPEYRKRLSDAARVRSAPPEYRQKMRDAQLRTPFSPQELQEFSERSKRQFQDPKARRALSEKAKIRCASPDYLRKMSAALTGIKPGPETRLKQSQAWYASASSKKHLAEICGANKGRRHTETSRNNMKMAAAKRERDPKGAFVAQKVMETVAPTSDAAGAA